MDPKMDSGMVCKYYSVDEAIENGAAPVPISFYKTVDVQCTIDIMDYLLACEVSAILLFMISLPCLPYVAQTSLCLDCLTQLFTKLYLFLLFPHLWTFSETLRDIYSAFEKGKRI
jgi:hypothetical protein